MLPVVPLALLAGAAIAVQANLNARLGVLLGSPMLAATVAFLVAGTSGLAAIVLVGKPLPATSLLLSVPVHLWFAGGALAAVGVGLLYHLVPRMGLGSAVSCGVAAQLAVSALASHHGWLGMPVHPLTPVRLLGLVGMVLGATALNWGE